MEEIKTSEITPTPTKRTAEEQEMFNLDVTFMLDATGSMQPSIDMARNKIKQFISDLKAQYTDSEVRIAIVAYRDDNDKDQYEVFPFNTSVDAAHKFLGSLTASGGNDHPEDVNGGFRNALALEWKQYTTKMIYHLADAPCHGGERFGASGDSHPKGLKNDEPWEKLLKKLYDMDINYLYFDIGGTTKKMFDEFKKMYEANGEKSHLIFSYEVLSNPRPTNTMIYSSASGSFSGLKKKSVAKESTTLTRSKGSVSKSIRFDDADYGMKEEKMVSKPSESDEKFVKATVSNAMNQMMRNVSYQSAKLKK